MKTASSLIKKKFGDLAKEVVMCCKKKEIRSLFNVLKSAFNATIKSLEDHDGLFRETLKIMVKKNPSLEKKIQKQIEYALRKWLINCLQDGASKLESFINFLGLPIVVAVKIFFTSSSVADEKGELYLTFAQLEYDLDRRIADLHENILNSVLIKIP